MYEHGAYCGVDCDACEAYLGTVNNEPERLEKMAAMVSKMMNMDVKPEQMRCLGCYTDEKPQVGYVQMCPIRSCARGRGHRLCSDCADYGCENLQGFWSRSPLSAKAKENLDKLRAEKG